MLAVAVVSSCLAIHGPVVEWSAPPEGCPRPTSLESVVDAELAELSGAERDDVTLGVRIEPATVGVTIDVRVTHAGTTTHRILAVEHCGLVPEAVALIVGLALSPSQNDPPAPASASVSTSHLPEPEVVTRPALATPSERDKDGPSIAGSVGIETLGVPIARPRRGAPPPVWVVGLTGGLRLGFFGTMGTVLGAAVGPQWRRLRIEVGVQHGLTSPLRSLSFPGTGVEVSSLCARFFGGPVFPLARRGALSVGGLVELGALRAASFGVDRGRAVRLPWLTLGAGAALHWGVLRWLSLTLAADGGLAPMRHVFVLGDEARVLTQTNRWGGALRAGAELHFF